MVEENPYLDRFLLNSRKAKADLDTPEIIGEIERRLSTCEGWDRGTFTTLIDGRYGLKRRDEDQTIVEATVMADLYTPELEISPFVVLYRGGNGLVYIVRDFGGFDLYTGETEAYKFPPIRDAIKHMIRRGYGVRDGKIPDEQELLKPFVTYPRNLWMNIFLFDGKNRWAMVDFDLLGIVLNWEEIYEGANDGTGNFARLKSIWQRLNSQDYTIEKKL